MLEIRRLDERQLPQLVEFMGGVFGPGLSSELLDKSFLHWKFFEPYPGWNEDKSYIILQGDGVVAHACLWPAAFACATGEGRCSHILDWAGSPSTPGAGIAVYQHLLALTESAFVVGGSDQAKRLLPRLGFQLRGAQRVYARVVRPWTQFRSRTISSPLREIARLARNTLWSLGAVRPLAEWSAQPAAEAGEALDRLTSSWRPKSYCSGIRSAALVNYLLRCPAAKMRLNHIDRAGTLAGYFMLNVLGGQCRIVDMFLTSEEREDWRAAFSVALRTAAEIRDVCEVVATASLDWAGEVLEDLGFRLRQEKPIFLHDRNRRFAVLPPPLIQMVDSDAFFLHDPSYPYLT